MASKNSLQQNRKTSKTSVEAESSRHKSAGEGELMKVGGRVLSAILPPDKIVWDESRRLVTDKNIRVEDLAVCASQDPVIVIELLKTANAMYFSGGRPPITSTKTAIIRLGLEVVTETLENLKKRPAFENEDVAHWFEIHRSRCKRASIVSRILAESLAKILADDCQAAGLLIAVGEMVAVAHFAEHYVKLSEDLSRSGINYRLAQDFKFDVEKVGLLYLRRNGMPETLLFALDREAILKTPERAIMKPLIMSAGEMIDAFDSNRWEKLAPGKTLPSKSSLRLLQMQDSTYLKLYERASEYLYSMRALEEKKRAEALRGVISFVSNIPNISTEISYEDPLEAEIQSILRGEGESQKETAFLFTPEESIEEKYSLNKEPKRTARVPRVVTSAGGNEVETTLGQTQYAKASQIVSEFGSIMHSAKTSEELLSELLQMLVSEGVFEKAAIVVVSKDRKSALVVAARGIACGQSIDITNPLSPLAACFSKVQSFGTMKSEHSPFGSNTFALAPIDADHDTPVALYADCGSNGSLTLEARRIFRTVVDILNQKLPNLPGGIPVELRA